MDQPWDLSDRPSVRGINETQITHQRYRHGSLLGKGGMGEVLEAHDDQIGREVAIKRLRAATPTEKQIARFMREARIQGRLEHPAIVPVHELGRDGEGRPYFAMKRLAGTTLSQILHDGESTKYPRQRLLRALSDVCLAVELAHTRGFVHRDLKPENIMLGDFGETYVLDWGVAKVTGEDDSDLVSVDTGSTNVLHTAAGALVGTPGYMSPEQALAKPDVDPRADVYSLGSVLFEVLAGERLHPGGQAALTTTVHGVETRPSVRRPDRDVPPELDELCVQALQIERDQRIQTARELGERIQQYLDGDRDLVLRRTLASQHLDAATTAFAFGDRSRAMREAGRALALDPTLQRAGELITRMMLEPPPQIPAEVTTAFERESSEVVRRTATWAAAASGAYVLFVPLLAALGGSASQLTLMAVIALASMALLLWMRKPGRAFVAAPVIVLHVMLTALVARMFSPFLFGPGLAAVTAIGFMTGPQYAKRQATWIWLLTCAAVILPYVAERAGMMSSTFSVFDGGVTMYSDMIHSQAGYSLLLIMYTVTIVGAGVLLARGLRVSERAARRSMHLQAWQLRQLVGDQ